jgi:hypothetical protein
MIVYIVSFLTLHLGSSILFLKCGANVVNASGPMAAANLPADYAAHLLTS